MRLIHLEFQEHKVEEWLSEGQLPFESKEIIAIAEEVQELLNILFWGLPEQIIRSRAWGYS